MRRRPMKKVLVTGSRGLIGGVALPIMREHGIEVVEYDRAIDPADDCADIQRLSARMAGCEAVVHMAAISWPDPKMTRGQFFQQNIFNAFNAVEAANQAGVQKFIFTSSTTVYGYEDGMSSKDRSAGAGQEKYLDWVLGEELGDLIVEGVEKKHKLAYITAKIAAEAVIAQYGLTGEMRVAIIRVAPARSPEAPYLGLAVDGTTLSKLIARVILELSNKPGLQIMDAVEPSLLSEERIYVSPTDDTVFNWYLEGEEAE
jgi:nucleoside-diphosphate-sugar epimerase